MSFLVLGTLLAVLAFGAASAVGSFVAAMAWWALRGRIEKLAPARRARFILTLRLLPSFTSIVFTVVFFIPAFVLHEPRDTVEVTSATMVAAALLAAALLLRGPIATFVAWRRTRQLVQGWLAGAEPIALEAPVPTVLVELPFPVVAVVGVCRPRIVVARSVKEACSEEELKAVLEHETAHLKRGDNFTRHLVRGAPDLLTWTNLGSLLEREWSEATEEAADRCAGAALAIPLASALVKVARLAVGTSPLPALETALYRQSGLARRIGYLTGIPKPCESSFVRATPWPFFAASIALVIAATPSGWLHRLHTFTELVVALLQ
ncbi:MAG TPA: M56 family metallopeptidase [Vicinamibacteria bacterium]|nr:M56 family metallopeptidase [Vicinamibacteria bacterium]